MLRELDTDLLESLTHRVRFLSAEQIARTWWADARLELARRRLRELAQEGWVRIFAAPLPPELPLTEPLATWEPGAAPPHFGALAHAAQRRKGGDTRATELVAATTRAERVLGGRAGLFKLDSLFHDLNVGALYLRVRSENPEDAENWVSEDQLVPEKGGDVCADVELRDDAGRAYRVLEFAGTSYKAERFERIHDDAAFRGIPYAVW